LGRKAHIIGRDISSDLIDLALRLSKPQDKVYQFIDALEVWRMESSEKARKRMKTNLLIEIQDKYETLCALSEGLDTVDQVIKRIEAIFVDEEIPGINFSTIHRAKGLEANNIYILAPDKMPHPMAKQEWEIVQEYNLMYVMITRVLSDTNGNGRLIYVHGD
jgi:superfamily I DNA/RNA helicase